MTEVCPGDVLDGCPVGVIVGYPDDHPVILWADSKGAVKVVLIVCSKVDKLAVLMLRNRFRMCCFLQSGRRRHTAQATS